MSLRGAQRRGNLPVQCFHTAVHFDGWYQEIAPQGHFLASLRAPRPFGPRNDSRIESFRGALIKSATAEGDLFRGSLVLTDYYDCLFRYTEADKFCPLFLLSKKSRYDMIKQKV